MEELVVKFKGLNKEQKINFIKIIIPEICKEFGNDQKKIMSELMPICKDMMGNCNMDMMTMMSKIQR